MKKILVFLSISLLITLPSLLYSRETGHEVFFGPSPLMPPARINSPGSVKGAKTVQNSVSVSLLMSVVLRFDFFWDDNNDGETYIPVSRIEPNRLFQKYLKGKSVSNPF